MRFDSLGQAGAWKALKCSLSEGHGFSHANKAAGIEASAAEGDVRAAQHFPSGAEARSSQQLDGTAKAVPFRKLASPCVFEGETGKRTKL